MDVVIELFGFIVCLKKNVSKSGLISLSIIYIFKILNLISTTLAIKSNRDYFLMGYGIS